MLFTELSSTNYESIDRQITHNKSKKSSIHAMDFGEFLKQLPKNSVDLMLTDPPYAISRKTGFEKVGKNGVERFAVSMEFGEWDKQEIDLDKLATLSYKALRSGGTAIVFYDIWKITLLADALTRAGYKQLRLIEWIKTNPVPLNSKRNYLTNSREIAVSAVKGGSPTFHSEYDKGIYTHPIPHTGKRYHPTQKPLSLIERLVEVHSNPSDVIIDPFCGCGTMAVAATKHNREFKGCDIDKNYAEIARSRVKDGK